MKSFKDYLTETELMEDSPSPGDVFELEIAREEIVIETTIVDVLDDGIVIEADDAMMKILMHVGYLRENSNMPTVEDSTSPIIGQNRRAQDAFKELDNARSGSPSSLDQDAESFRQRARSGQAGKPAKWSEMSPIEQEELRRQGFGPRSPTNEADASTDPFSMDDTDAWANKIRKTVPKTPIDTTNWTDEQRYTQDRKMGKFQGPGGFDEWKANRASRTQPQPVTPSTTVPTNEAKYQGREVPLGKKMAGDVKKSKVYVRGPKGNVVKVNFGDPNMTIKKSNPARRKSFRARHNCANPGPRWKARYWSCRSW